MENQEEIPKVKGVWSAVLDVECPHCGWIFNVFDNTILDTYEVGICENREDLGEELKCPKCKKEMIMDRTEW